MFRLCQVIEIIRADKKLGNKLVVFNPVEIETMSIFLTIFLFGMNIEQIKEKVDYYKNKLNKNN